MNKEDYFCPMPTKWNEIYMSLVHVWKREGSIPAEKPPKPLILAAWHDTTESEKQLRWKETIYWVEKHNCEYLIPELKDEEKFKGK